jgi:hypothetical protein
MRKCRPSQCLWTASLDARTDLAPDRKARRVLAQDGGQRRPLPVDRDQCVHARSSFARCDCLARFRLHAKPSPSSPRISEFVGRPAVCRESIQRRVGSREHRQSSSSRAFGARAGHRRTVPRSASALRRRPPDVCLWRQTALDRRALTRPSRTVARSAYPVAHPCVAREGPAR